jgi:hypothetical protein
MKKGLIFLAVLILISSLILADNILISDYHVKANNESASLLLLGSALIGVVIFTRKRLLRK